MSTKALALQLACVALALIALVVWFSASAFGSGGLLGAPQTDVIRAVWGLDHTWQSLPRPPFWTERLAFPVGVKIVILPQFSALLGAPLVGMFGAIRGYNLWILSLWAASGCGSALLAWRLSDSPAAALLAGTVMIIQPMTFLAITDGTAEFVAWWTVPLALTALYTAGRTLASHVQEQRMWAMLAGLLLGLVALDSPYHAIFCIPFLPLVFGWHRWRRQGRTLVGITLVGLILLALYFGLPLAAPHENTTGNAVTLRVWRQWEVGETRTGWDYSLGAGFIPYRVLLVLLGLAFLRLSKAYVWVLVGVVALVLALQLHPDNAAMLRIWLGNDGSRLSHLVSAVNQVVTPPVIRFPRRWLVPAAQALALAGALGLTAIPKEWTRWLVAIPVSAWMVWHTESIAHFQANFPHFDPPKPAFTDFIRESDTRGAVLFLPRQRGAVEAVGRQELPVFAELSRDISSADLLWMQVLCRRSSFYWPEGLRTAVRRSAFDPETEKLLHDLDDTATPVTTGAPIPLSASQEPDRRARAAAALADKGLSFVAIDEHTYGEAGMKLLRAAFESVTVNDRHFDDGTGVTVLSLSRQ